MLNKENIVTNSRTEFIDITSQVRSAVKKSGIVDGLVTVFSPHTTSGITINENADPDVLADMEQKLNSLIPEGENYSHLEGNSDSHIKSTFTGVSETIIIENRELLLGIWQSIYFCEYDGPRRRKVFIKVT